MFPESRKAQPAAGESADAAASARAEAQGKGPEQRQAAESHSEESFAVEVVFRYRVPDGASGGGDFLGTIDTWARTGGSDGVTENDGRADARSPARVTLWQPVVGSDPDLWEVRLSFTDHASLGRLMDEQPGRLASLQRLPLASADAVDVPNPVLRRVRTWDWPPRTRAPGAPLDEH